MIPNIKKEKIHKYHHNIKDQYIHIVIYYPFNNNNKIFFQSNHQDIVNFINIIKIYVKN